MRKIALNGQCAIARRERRLSRIITRIRIMRAYQHHQKRLITGASYRRNAVVGLFINIAAAAGCLRASARVHGVSRGA